ncbi:hypothetical protein [Polyangium sp. y55x31]|uniref:hypothetical protein n=1 Tax=Polyangium sp. y55x31 TaxID=3042688 RepID=UPI0024828B54|nr:hypothetical protein [Polyangium sp. y55x31]MDI1476535.1 hypothetical protein [Polyangium sp. y55x31]
MAKLDPNGNHLWSRRSGDASSQAATSTVIDNVFIAGWFLGSLDFGTGPLVANFYANIFLTKLTP